MLCLKFCKGAPLCTITAALSRLATAETSGFKSVETSWKVCRPVTAKRHLSCVSQRRPPLLSNQIQAQSVDIITRKGIYYRFAPAQSALLLPRLSPLILLRSFYKSASTQASIRWYLIHKNPHLRFHATVSDPTAIFLQPFDSSCRRQSVRRGFAISLPILAIYLLLYLLNFVPWDSNLGQQYKSIVVRFWTYQRHEGFQNVASLGTYITSQFTHNGLIYLVIDSLVLIGVASVLGSVFNRRRFFAVYVCGGFLAAAADCAWARLTNPSRSLTQAQCVQISTSASLFNEALAKMVKLRASSPIFTIRGFFELLTNPKEFERKFSGDLEELRKQQKVADTNYPLVRDWDRWTRPNSAASGSLVCLVSVAALIRPRTIINLIGARPSILLYNLTAGTFVFNLCMLLATNSP